MAFPSQGNAQRGRHSISLQNSMSLPMWPTCRLGLCDTVWYCVILCDTCDTVWYCVILCDIMIYYDILCEFMWHIVTCSRLLVARVRWIRWDPGSGWTVWDPRVHQLPINDVEGVAAPRCTLLNSDQWENQWECQWEHLAHQERPCLWAYLFREGVLRELRRVKIYPHTGRAHWFLTQCGIMKYYIWTIPTFTNQQIPSEQWLLNPGWLMIKKYWLVRGLYSHNIYIYIYNYIYSYNYK